MAEDAPVPDKITFNCDQCGDWRATESCVRRSGVLISSNVGASLTIHLSDTSIKLILVTLTLHCCPKVGKDLCHYAGDYTILLSRYLRLPRLPRQHCPECGPVPARYPRTSAAPHSHTRPRSQPAPTRPGVALLCFITFSLLLATNNVVF